MATMEAGNSALLVIDFQAKLMPAIEEGAAVVGEARRLVEAARLLGAPVLFTEQNPSRLGPTAPELEVEPKLVVAKMTFDACRTAGVVERLPEGRAVVVAGCEAHVCVLQTVLGLIGLGRKVFVARDAVGSRRAASREAGIARMAAHGAEIVTTEMVVFEWLGSADHPRFREALAAIK